MPFGRLCPRTGVIYFGGRCQCSACVAYRKRVNQRRGGDRTRYDSEHQRRAAAAIQAQPYCADCGHTGSAANPLTADHERPLAHGGKHGPLTVRCRPCNSRRGGCRRGGRRRLGRCRSGSGRSAGRATVEGRGGIFDALTGRRLGTWILGLHFQSAELAKLALALVVSCFACTALGLCIGALGLRGRSVSVFAACIGALMLIVSGANVPFDRLPHVVRTVASGSL